MTWWKSNIRSGRSEGQDRSVHFLPARARGPLRRFGGLPTPTDEWHTHAHGAASGLGARSPFECAPSRHRAPNPSLSFNMPRRPDCIAPARANSQGAFYPLMSVPSSAHWYRRRLPSCLPGAPNAQFARASSYRRTRGGRFLCRRVSARVCSYPFHSGQRQSYRISLARPGRLSLSSVLLDRFSAEPDVVGPRP